jgi:tRNA 2-thiouridine synthesizing protein E
MPIEVDGTIIATTASAFLQDPDAWSKTVAEAMAAAEGLELTAQHWDVIDYLRREYFENNGHQPNNRALLKEMGGAGDTKSITRNCLTFSPAIRVSRLAACQDSRKACAKVATDRPQPD